MMRWFRRHRRYLLAGVVVMLMVSWGILGTVNRLVHREEPPLGIVHGEEVTAADGHEAVLLVKVAQGLGYLSPTTLQSLQYMPGSYEAKRMVASLGLTFAPFIMEKGEGGRDESPWRTAILLREAQAAGVQVTDQEARDLLAMSPVMMGFEGLNTDRYLRFRQSYNLSDGQMARVMHRIAQIAKLLMIRRDGIRASRAELWADWQHSRERAKIAVVTVDASWFEGFVDPTDEELKSFYEEHKNDVPDPDAGVIGFKAPERVRIEYAVADPAEFAAQAEVSDEEIASYYEEHKDQFVVDETSDQAADQTSDETSGEAPDQAAESAPAEAADEAPDPAADEEPPAAEAMDETAADAAGEPSGEQAGGQADAAEAGEQEPAEQTKYVPLEEARAEIRETIAQQKGREAADDAVRRVMDALSAVSPDYANDRQPLAQMARRNGLKPVVASTPDGRQLLSRREVADLVPQGSAVAAYAFDQPEVLYFPHVVDRGSPPLVCQVIEKRDSEVQPYDEVADQVRSRYVEGAALKQAATFAEKLRTAAAENGLAAAVEEMAPRLRDLLHDRQDAGDLLAVKETGFFTRGVRRIPGLEGGAAAVAAKAFSLKADAVGLVVEEAPDYKCYVMQVVGSEEASREEFGKDSPMMRAFYVGDKQQRAMGEWLEGLLAAAKPDLRSAFWKETGKPEE